MKKLFFLVLLLASPAFAARALLLSIVDIAPKTEPPNPAVVRWDVRAAYQGPDVPGLVQTAALTVAVSTSTTLVQIQAAIVGAIQAEATNRGFTVPAGNTILPSYTSQ